MLSEILGALASLATLPAVTMILLGAGIGLLFGMLPGLGASQAMILLLPFTYGMEPELAIILFIAIMATATFGGSLPAILLNTPGTPANVVTTLDGYPMATRGEANRAIAISAAACAVGTVIGAAVLLSSIPVLQALISAFHQQERFWLIVFGLSTIALASRGNAVKGLVAGAVGVLISFVGRNYVFAGDRFSGDLAFLYDGIPLAAFLVGVFAVAPMFVIGARTTVVKDGVGAAGAGSALEAIRQGFGDVYRHKVQAVRGSVVGVFLGIVPAVGGAAAAFINYFLSKQFSRGEREFGDGSPEGLIASETANDAKDGGTLMPTLSFGIPGDPNTAVLLGALLMHGVPIGFNLFENHRNLLLQIVITLVVAQLVVSALGLSVSRIASKLTTVNTSYIVPLVFAFSLVGAFLYRGNGWDLLIVAFAALLAYGLTRNNFPAISLVLGYLLGQEAERNFMMALRADDRWYVALLDSWISWVLIVLIIATFLISGLMNRRTKADKDAADHFDPAPDASSSPDAPAGATATLTEVEVERRRKLESVGFGGLLLVVVLAFGGVALTYDRDMQLFPLVVSAFALLLLVPVVLAEFSPAVSRLVTRLGGGLQEREESLLARDERITRVQFRIGGWLAATVAATMALGFLAMPVMVALYIRFQGRRSWVSALALAAALLVGVAAMGMISGVRFWPGAVPTVWPGLIGGGRLPI